MTSYYPLFLNLSGRLCIIVGGGKVAERKAHGLVKASARVRIVSPRVTKGIEQLLQEGKIELALREYREGDLEGAFLAFAATDQKEVNEKVAAESARRAVPLNVADSPDRCDFIVPSRVDNGPVTIAISTSGLAPVVAKKLKGGIVSALGADYGVYARRVGTFRKFLMEHVENANRRKEILRQVAEANVSEVCRLSLEGMKKRFLGKKDK